MKKIKWLIIGFLVAVVALLTGIVIYADHLTKLAVETAGTRALGVTTTLDDADISLLGGSVSLTDLDIQNPPGYHTPSLLRMGYCSTRVDLGSIWSDTISVKTIRIEDLLLTVEQKGLTSNLAEILDKIEQMQQNEESQPPAEEDLGGKKLLVERIEIVDAAARIKLLNVPGETDVVKVKLAPITLENISQEQDKATLTLTVFRSVLMALANGLVESGVSLPGELKDALIGSVDRLKKTIGKGTLDIAVTTGKALELGEKAIEETRQKVENILQFPAKKEEKDKKETKKIPASEP